MGCCGRLGRDHRRWTRRLRRWRWRGRKNRVSWSRIDTSRDHLWRCNRTRWCGNWGCAPACFDDRAACDFRRPPDPDVEYHCHQPSDAKLQHGGENGRNVVLALAEIEGRLRISSHLPRQKGHGQVAGERHDQAPYSFGDEHGDQHAANPVAGGGLRIWGGRLRKLVHGRVMLIVAQLRRQGKTGKIGPRAEPV